MSFHKHRALAAAVLMTLSGIGWAQSGSSAQTVTFNITAPSLVDALIQFTEQSGLQLAFPTQGSTQLPAPQVVGELTPKAALDRLLKDSGLKYEFTNDRTVSITSAETMGDASTEGKRQDLRLARADAASGSAGTSGQVHEDKRNGSDVAQGAEAGRFDEVIVTATKRAESVQDVPVSIAVIGNQEIERRGLIGMEDYLRSIPGVNEIDNGGRSNAIVIRGITTSPEYENFGNASGTTVATYFDESPITGAGGIGAGGIDIRPVDIERIEVLRGPQGTAFGNFSLGGTLRIIPAKPRLDGFGGSVAAAYSDTSGPGSDNTMIQGVVNIPVVESKFALRAVGYRYEDSGFYRNNAGDDPVLLARYAQWGLDGFLDGYTQDDVGRMRSTGGRLAALWQATEKLSLGMSFLTQKIEQDGEPVATVASYANSTPPVSPQQQVRGRNVVSDTQIDLLNAVLNYDLNWGTWTTVASRVDSGSYRSQVITIPVFPPGSTSSDSDFESFTGETRIASQLSGRVQFLVGLFYENVDESLIGPYYWSGSEANNPLGTTPMYLYKPTRDLEHRAMFGEVSYDITDRLKATVGGRYFRYEKSTQEINEGGLVGVPIGAGTAPVLRGTKSDTIFKANLSYKPTEQSMLYASWSEGFRLGRPAPGVPAATCDTNGDGIVENTNISIASTQTVNSDFLENYEVGSKFSLFDRRMVVDASVYHIKWDGLPTYAVMPAPCSWGYTANLGAATSDGVELQASVFVTEGLRFDFGAGYNKAELSEAVVAQSWPDGAPLPGSPKLNANLAAQYDFKLAGRNAFVRADSFYTSKFYGDLLESLGTLAGDYIKVDARAGMEFSKLSVELFVRNLTNEDAFTWRGLTPGITPFAGYLLRPRTVGLQLGYSFE